MVGGKFRIKLHFLKLVGPYLMLIFFLIKTIRFQSKKQQTESPPSRVCSHFFMTVGVAFELQSWRSGKGKIFCMTSERKFFLFNIIILLDIVGNFHFVRV